MESVLTMSVALWIISRQRRNDDATKRRRRCRALRRRHFVRLQSRERMFVTLSSTTALTMQSPVRSSSVRPRRNVWWEEVVNGTFQSQWYLWRSIVRRIGNRSWCCQWYQIFLSRKWREYPTSIDVTLRSARSIVAYMCLWPLPSMWLYTYHQELISR